MDGAFGDAAGDAPAWPLAPPAVDVLPGAADGEDPVALPTAEGAAPPAVSGVDGDCAVDVPDTAASPAGEVGIGEVWADDGVEPSAAWARSRSDRCVPHAVAATTAQSSAAEARHVVPLKPW